MDPFVLDERFWWSFFVPQFTFWSMPLSGVSGFLWPYFLFLFFVPQLTFWRTPLSWTRDCRPFSRFWRPFPTIWRPLWKWRPGPNGPASSPPLCQGLRSSAGLKAEQAQPVRQQVPPRGLSSFLVVAQNSPQNSLLKHPLVRRRDFYDIFLLKTHFLKYPLMYPLSGARIFTTAFSPQKTEGARRPEPSQTGGDFQLLGANRAARGPTASIAYFPLAFPEHELLTTNLNERYSFGAISIAFWPQKFGVKGYNSLAHRLIRLWLLYVFCSCKSEFLFFISVWFVHKKVRVSFVI